MASQPEIRYVTAPCRLGIVLVAESVHGICAVSLGNDTDELIATLRRDFAESMPACPRDALVVKLGQIVHFLENPGEFPDLPLDPGGTDFQRTVWNALRDIPVGSTETYSSIAARLGMPSAARAVGSAIAANRIALLIPCHRAVGANRRLAGFRWGVERKRALLQREAEHRGLFSPGGR